MMKKLIDDDDTRESVAFANFKRKVSPDPYTRVGPNTVGEYYWPVSVSENGKRVGYSLIAP